MDSHSASLLDPTPSVSPYWEISSFIFWSHFCAAYAFNFTIFFPFVYYGYSTAGDYIPVMGLPLRTTVAWNFVWFAVLCGLSTPVLSTPFIKKSVRAGRAPKLYPIELRMYTLGWLVTPTGLARRTLRIALSAAVWIGGGAMLVAVLTCDLVEHSENLSRVVAGQACSVPRGTFLALSLAFTLVVQVPVFWCNFVACCNASAFLEEWRSSGPPEECH